MEKEQNPIITQSKEVDSDEVWGNPQRIIEIIGEGSGNGFKLQNANLPREWEKSLDCVKKIDLSRFADFHAEICVERAYKLEEMSFDSNNILTLASIRNLEDGLISEISLSDSWLFKRERGEYISNNLRKIGSAVIFQTMLSRYLGHGWGRNFDYGYIDGLGIGVYGPIDLKVPKDIFNKEGQITGEDYQKDFCDKAHNIAGRFGLEMTNIDFDGRGILHTVNVTGDRTYYSLEDCGYNKRRQYVSHNVDRADQAAALHGIVASYINFLLDKYRKDEY